MNLGNQIRSGAKWLLVGNTGRQLLTFLFGIVLARLLAPADFGALVTISVFTGLAGFIAGGGMGQALVHAKKTTKDDYDIVFTLQLGIGCIIYAIFFVVAPSFAEYYNNPLYSDLLRVSALSFIFRPLANIPSSILYREMRFKEQTYIGIATLIFANGVSIYLAWIGYGVWSLILGGIASSVLAMIILIPLSRWRPGFSLDFRRGRDIARYGFLVSVTDILVYLRTQAGVFIISRTLGPTAVGLYNKGESLALIPHSFITGSVYQVLFRAMSSEQDNIDKCRYLFFRSVSLVAVYATPFYVGLLWLAEPFVRGIYGPKWVEASYVLFILALAWPFWLMGNLSGAVLAARNWLDREVLVQVSTLIVTVLAILIGLSYGIAGVAFAIAGAAVFSGFYNLWLALTCLEAHWTDYGRALTPAVLLNTLLAGVLYTTNAILPDSLRGNDYAYMLTMASIGGGTYALAFLYFPFNTLQPEQERWKSALRLPQTKKDS